MFIKSVMADLELAVYKEAPNNKVGHRSSRVSLIYLYNISIKQAPKLV